MASSPLGELAPFGGGPERLSVLLVDDDEQMVELSATYLERELPDADTTGITDPSAALAELRENAETYDCVVSDFDMPGMDGLELFAAIREAEVEVPFVLFTGKGSEEIASRAISAGVDEYLQKGGTEEYPVLANKVENLVEKYWAERQVRKGFLAIESAEEGIGIIDDGGVYQYMNEAYAEVYDRDRAELIGRHWEVLYPSDETRRFNEEILPELESEGTWRGRSTGVTEGGRLVPEQLVLTQMDDGGHVCIVQELGRSDELESELELKTNALDAASVGIVITDPTVADNPVVYVNEGFEELTGYDTQEALGLDWELLRGPETDPETVATIRDAVEEREPIAADVRAYDADDEPFWVHVDVSPIEDDDGRVSQLVWFLSDVTKRRQREERLRSSTARLEALFENSPDMIVTHDADGVLRDVNQRMCEELGYEEEELIGKRAWDVDTEVDPDRARDFWADCPSNTPHRFEGELRRRDGSTFPVEIHLIRLDLDGADRFVAMDRDISDQKAREAELIERNERLDRFASVVSHDLRNPLTVANGRLTLLADEVDSEHIDHIDRALTRMDDLVDDLLALAREGEGAIDVEPVPVAEVTRACWETIETGDATLSAESEFAVEADENRLRQLLENLVANAVEHGGDGVSVTVGSTDSGFFVADDGPGIPPSERDRVSDAGYTTAEGGTGFGLSIVKRVADAHGWRIDIGESDDGGARFEFSGVDFRDP
ncbi:PAS domain S-box protein [Halobaculum sp. CBA1158]|uniref:PAS domain S-box protein n=1 Tax=Halobaculum sp. CBA1158 TaxID=2904243 RepID=UPI001F369F2D|nr:PAS domain S-box protein [Halobaculum sp. CBA1158]UIP01195.1 PAS domain S-box protein [Halobaculum sp. CBA1158]